jgi:YidC/Oxa1 family membrane protein insertase
LYNIIPGHDLGVAIIILTVLIRLALYPLFQKGIKSQKELAVLQPKIKELQKKYKNEKEKQARALMDLYKEHGVNPMSGCLPMLIQLPILWAFFRVLITGLGDSAKLSLLYGFVNNPGALNTISIHLFDLTKPNYILAFLAGATQFVQGKMLAPKSSPAGGKDDFASAMNKQMIYMMPVIIFLAALKMPAGLPLYWTALNIFGIIQQYLMIRKQEPGAKNQELKKNTLKNG